MTAVLQKRCFRGLQAKCKVEPQTEPPRTRALGIASHLWGVRLRVASSICYISRHHICSRAGVCKPASPLGMQAARAALAACKQWYTRKNTRKNARKNTRKNTRKTARNGGSRS
jgi:hypothetical protein